MTTLAQPRLRSGGVGDVLWALASKREVGLSLLLVVIAVVVGIRNPTFLAPANLETRLVECTQTAIVACGVMLVIVTGEIDISVGSMLGLLTAVIGTLVSPKAGVAPAGAVTGLGWPVWAAIMATLGLGAMLGFLNGVLVTLVRVPSIIVTLAMLMILQAVTQKLMWRGNITALPENLMWFGKGDLGSLFGWHDVTVAAKGDVPAHLEHVLNVPLGHVSIWIMGAVLLGTWGMIKFTPLGRRIFAVGSNAHAATLSGVSVARIKVFTFAFTGFLVGVATVVTTLGAYDNGIGTGFELLVVTCVVVGGVSISGGVGTVAGIFLGVVLLTIQKPVLVFMNLGPGWSNWDKAIQGLLILAAVLVDHFAGQRKKKAGGH